MIFWWNPLAYLLCKDLDQIIELNCDNAMSKKYSEMDTLYYLDTLTYMAGGRRANFDEYIRICKEAWSKTIKAEISLCDV